MDSITSGGSGAGNGTVRCTRRPHTERAHRHDDIGGQTFTVNRPGGSTSAYPFRAELSCRGRILQFAFRRGELRWRPARPTADHLVRRRGCRCGPVRRRAANTATARSATVTITRLRRDQRSTALSPCPDGDAPALAAAPPPSWTANSTVSWLTVRGSASGQGDGSVDYVVAPKQRPGLPPGPPRNQRSAGAGDAVRRGLCMSLQESSASFSPSGGSGTIVVRASSAQCTWTAASDSSWITIRIGHQRHRQRDGRVRRGRDVSVAAHRHGARSRNTLRRDPVSGLHLLGLAHELFRGVGGWNDQHHRHHR